MCGRYTVLTEDELIEVRSIINEVSLKIARDELTSLHEPRHEVAPSNNAPVITSNRGDLLFEHAKFGFERWDGKGVIINARAETAKDKPMFKNYVSRGRCVVPASGYYEWKPEANQRKKVKHLIKDQSGNLLFMAGLYRDGRDGREFVIITKDPVGEVAGIHDRMPVILKTDQLEPWLTGDLPIDDLTGLDYDCSVEPCEAPGNVEQLTLLD